MSTPDERTQVKTGADHSIPAFAALADLASARVGGRALTASDDFFASKSNLLKPEPPIFIPAKFTSRGKWMDGWESRRRRTPGHDWCVIALGMRGRVRGVNVDTRHFTGNYPSHCSIDALDADGPLRPGLYTREGSPWAPLLPRSALRGNGDNFFAVDDGGFCTHLRLNIFPDGGVARLRVYGDVEIDWAQIARAGRTLDLAAIRHGGLVLAASDMHFGAKDNMIMPGRAKNMGDGWETRRRRSPDPEPATGLTADWAIVRLGSAAHIRRVEIDTTHFKGNFPDSASMDGCLQLGASVDTLVSAPWTAILPQTKLRADRRHVFSQALRPAGLISHVRLNIFPDGGVSRLRVYGTVSAD
jgi:allantoicase